VISGLGLGQGFHPLAGEGLLQSVGVAFGGDQVRVVQQPVDRRGAMIDRLVRHAEVISLKGDSYRLRNRGDLGRIPAAKTDT